MIIDQTSQYICLYLFRMLFVLDPKVKARVRNYLAQTSNLHYSEIPDYDLNASLPSSPRLSPTNSTKTHGACHRVTTSDPTCRPSRIPTIIKGTSKSCPQSPHGPKPKVSHIPTPNGTNNFQPPSSPQQPLSSSGTNQLSSIQQNPPSHLEPNKRARFEAYMMTGDLMLNLSRTPQSSGLITSHSKKVDSLRDSPKQRQTVANRRNGALAPHAKGESSLSSPSFSDSSDSVNSIKKSIEKDTSVSCYVGGNNNTATTTTTTTTTTVKNRDHIHDHSEYVIKSDIESGESSVAGDFSGDLTNDLSGCVSSSSSNSIMNKRQHINNSCTISDTVDCANPYNLVVNDSHNQSIVDGFLPQQHTSELQQIPIHNKYPISSSSSSTVKSGDNISTSPDGCFSVPTSPTSLTTPIIEALSTFKQRESANSVPTSPESGAQEIVLRRSQQQNGVVRKNDAAGFRTSRSEDHLQHTQRDILGAVVPIDIDEDVNSSLNTLLDTRQDSEDSQVSAI